ncbi:MAG: DGQHR domain-containing protein [Candidatus Methanomethylicaceae archaeon]
MYKEITAFKISQWGYGEGVGKIDLFVTALPLSILEKAVIDRWSRDNRKGYQRPPLERRLKPGKGSIVEYILKELGVFPTSVLLNIRGEIKFMENEKITENVSIGKLILPENEKLWIIDGQHRIEALKRTVREKPELEDYPLPVSILNLRDPDRFEEMLLFYIVNSRQKRIPTDVAYRHLQAMIEKVKIEEKHKWVKEAILGPSQERQGIAAEIVDYLDENEESPFYNKIIFLGEEPERGKLIEDSVMIRYISKLLTDATLGPMPPEEIANLLIDYWNAIKELYPNCFDPQLKDNYTLLKHTGIASFTYLFPTIYGLCARKSSVNKETMKKYLSYLQEKIDDKELDPDFRGSINEDWWSRAYGPSIARTVGEATFKIIRDQMAKKIYKIAGNKEALN